MLCVKCDIELNDDGKCTECNININDFTKDEKWLRDKLKIIIDKAEVETTFLQSVNFLFASKFAFTLLQDKMEAERLLLLAEESCETIINFCDVAKVYMLYFDNPEKARQLLNQARELGEQEEDNDYIVYTAKEAGIVCI